jgi:DNA repair photolyase
MLDRVADDPRCLRRMERMLAALGVAGDAVAVIGEAALPEVTAELATLWPPESVPAGRVRTYMRPLVFTTMDLGPRRTDLPALLERCPPGTTLGMLRAVLGDFSAAVDQHPHELDQRNDCVCWPTYNFGTVWGCPHGCLYCGEGREGKLMAVALNLEDYMERIVGPIIEANPWNKVFRMILNGADLITLEPEYGLHDLFTRKLAEYDDRWGHFHTASNNVAWMADLEHRDRLVGVWSATCEAVARLIEPGGVGAAERVEAGRLCQQMGIPVRFKFKPVIPVRDGRDEYAAIIEEIFRRTRPESVGFGLYMWSTYEQMARSLPLELLDADCVDAARQAADRMAGVRTGPFPHEVRRDIYRHLIAEVRRWDNDVPLYVSTESRQMWDELSGELGQDPRAYICACSSVAVPGRRLALSPGFRYSTYERGPV